MTVLEILLYKVMYWICFFFRKDDIFLNRIIANINDSIIRKIKLPDNIIIVTGSNGKTATVEMISTILNNSGFSVANNTIKNEDSLQSIIAMLIRNTSFSGNIKKDVLIIESKENDINKVLDFFKPKYLVVTNLYRDDMKINGHPETVLKRMNEKITQDIRLILNADDPISSLLGYKRDNVIYYGINKNVLSKEENCSVYNDANYCPNCSHLMKFDYFHFNHIGSYKCEKCGFSRKKPEYAITNIDYQNGKVIINKKNKISVVFQSIYHAYDILASFAISRMFGIDENKIVSSLTEYIKTKQMLNEFKIDNYSFTELKVKYDNSVSYNQSFLYLINKAEECQVILFLDKIDSIDSKTDTSWIWDIDFELLSENCIKKIYLFGRYANDLAVRFYNSNLLTDKVSVETNFKEILTKIDNDNEKIYVITYSNELKKLINWG